MGEGDSRKRAGPRDGGGGSANKKKMWRDNSRAKGVPLGTRGVLVSCVTGKENQAAREAINVFMEVYEHLCPAALDSQPAAEDGAAPNEDGGDISALIANEVAGLKDRSKQPFRFHGMGIGSLVYVIFNLKDGASPSEVVAYACREAKRTKQNKTRFCNRFYPVERVCASTMEEMGALAKELCAKHFPDDAEEGIKFSVEFEKRAAPPELERMAVVDLFAQAVKQPPHKVNLMHPTKSIMVNVAKGTCGVSIVDDYKELAKYNLRVLAQEGGEGEKAPATTTPAEEG